MRQHGSPQKFERNLELYRDFLSDKFTQVELVNKYKISTARIYQIIEAMKLRMPLGIPEEHTLMDYSSLDEGAEAEGEE